MILVSSCLAGFKVAYDGNSKTVDLVVKLVKEGKAIPVCPEQLGGLSTPRPPAEVQIINHELKVITNTKVDVTEEYVSGALKTLELCRLYNCDTVILKQNSPSCGLKRYDGTFSHNVIEESGMTAKLLIDNGIKVIASDDEESILKLIGDLL